MNHIIKDLLGKRLVFFDGAMGTLLQQNGLAAGELPELWNLSHPDLIRSIHRAYLDAGCDIIIANTFGANHIKLRGCGYSVPEVVKAGVSLAREAVNSCGRDAFVAMDLGPTGKLLRPMGDLDFEQAYQAFSEAAQAGAAAGADLMLIETMSDTYEVKAAVLAAKETGLPVFATMIFDEQGKLLTGGDIPAAVALLESLGVDAIGFNCGLGPEQMLTFLPLLMEQVSIPVIVSPNAGLPRSENGQTVFDVTPQQFAASMRKIAEHGAWILGGCCGTTPEHLAATIAACREISPVPISPKNRTVVSSYTHAVAFGERPIIIGERINPTGKKRFQQALRENDLDYILREGLTQQQNGADILDVNTGLPDIDETAMMCRAVTGLQSVTGLPLQIDTSNPATMEAALRLYNGKPLLNSVNGKQESMEQIFPLIKKYGGVAVALTLDENGIPETAEGRFAIAEKIVHTAERYGISRKDLIVDVLAMTISAGQESAAVALQALSMVRERLGVHTSLGVSNISFGLPQRELINATFLTMALQSGMSAAILNPNSQAMMNAYHSFCALSGADPRCTAYIAKYSGQVAEQPSAAGTLLTLKDAVRKGLRESAEASAAEALKSREPLEIIHNELVPALDEVGRRFEERTLFLPQLLMSAEAAKAAFEVLRTHMTAENGPQERRDKIVLATVKGDIHDIGKNIVKVLLENYSYDVIDLGKDVPPEEIVRAALENQVKLVGLSALMTTTVVNMEETIRQIRRDIPGCLVMVGGAVLNQEYASKIGADFYSPDAMGSVRYANRIFGHS